MAKIADLSYSKMLGKILQAAEERIGVVNTKVNIASFSGVRSIAKTIFE